MTTVPKTDHFERLVSLLWIGAGCYCWYLMIDLAFFVELTPAQAAARNGLDRAFPWVVFGGLGIYSFLRGIRIWKRGSQEVALLPGAVLGRKEQPPRTVPPMPGDFVDSVGEKLRRFEDFGIRSNGGDTLAFAQAVWQELHHLSPGQKITAKDADPYEILMKFAEGAEGNGASANEDILILPMDVEQFTGDYRRLAQKLAGFSQGALPLEQIEETDLAGDGSRCALTFALNGKPYRMELDVEPKMLNSDVLQWLGGLMPRKHGGVGLAALWDGTVTLVRLKDGQLEEFNAFFGMEFKWLGER